MMSKLHLSYILPVTLCMVSCAGENVKLSGSVPMVFVLTETVVLLAVLVTGILLYRRNRIIQQTNNDLVSEIAELKEYKEKYHAINHPEQPVVNTTAHDTADAPLNLDTLDAPALFRQISKVIIDEQLFLDAAFDRQHVIDRFHLSKERIGSAFTHGSNFASLAAFITACRLDYAARLLVEQPSLPVAQVSAASGFSSANHFGRAFKTAYGLSPTEFREQQGQGC